ncbi:MAG: tRNA pseudouridine(38-40) synthase TruA [Proteobacteria bacterium]|nr:tRNA pseudouridine(38-40) synthase TruA [Pseudomonadota bacterium]
MTQRFKIIVEYDGGNFVGWQAQENGPSVQVEIEDAIHAFSGERMRIIAAGRTDAGVHARGQVSHFDLEKEITADKLQAALNAHLRPQPISILSVELVPDDFSARFSATKRHYLYRILNRRAPPALNKGRAWHVAAPLDAGAMNEAAKRLIGRHDFTTFRAAGCQAKSPEKTLDALTVERDGEEILIRASAQSFLHNQVRSMVGTLKLVGEGKWSADDVTDALEARDRARVGFNAPPEGLYLMKVDY